MEDKEFKPTLFEYKGNIYETYSLAHNNTETKLIKQQDGSWAASVSYRPVDKVQYVDHPENIHYIVNYDKTFTRSIEDFLSKFKPLSEEEHKEMEKSFIY